MQYLFDIFSSIFGELPPEVEPAPPGVEEKKVDEGLVTSLAKGFGVVDGKYSVDLSKIEGDLQAGDVVSYSASRPATNREWVISEVIDVKRKKISGVLNENGDLRVFSSNSTTIYKDPRLCGFRKNDLVSAEVSLSANDSNEFEVLSFKPYRQKKNKVGILMKINGTFNSGLIDHNIQISPDIVYDGKLPSIGEYVEYDAVEVATYNSWRAIRCRRIGPSKKAVNWNAVGPLKSNMSNLLEDKNGITIENHTVDFGFIHFGVQESKKLKIFNRFLKTVQLQKVFILGSQENKHFTFRDVPNVIIDKAAIEFSCHGLHLGKVESYVCLQFFNDRHFSIGVRLCSHVIPQDVDRDHKFNSRSFTPKYSNDNGCRNHKIAPNYNFKLKDYPIPKAIMQNPSHIGECLSNKPPMVFENYVKMLRILLYLEEVEAIERMDSLQIVGARMFRNDSYFILVVKRTIEEKYLFIGDYVIVGFLDNPDVKYEGVIRGTLEEQIFVEFYEKFSSVYSGEALIVKFRKSRHFNRIFHHCVELAEQFLGKDVLFPSKINLKTPKVNLISETEVFVRAKTPRLCPPKFTPSFFEWRKTIRSDDKLNEYFLSPKYDMCLKTKLSNEKVDKNHCANIPNRFTCNTMENISSKPPYSPSAPVPKDLVSISWTKPCINPEQKAAVCAILKGETRPAPYVVFGPPGTGKTFTLAEAIIQIFILQTDSRILVTAPSNSAADTLMLKIIESGKILPGEMVRIFAKNQSIKELYSEIKEYLYLTEHAKRIPDHVIRNRVIITTCGKSFSLSKIKGMPKFTHIFLDEAGFVMEPESLLPLGLLDTDGQIILSGDPMQLAPVIKSPLAKRYGLALSLLERLCTQNPLYSRSSNEFRTKSFDAYNTSFITKLIRNYRNPQDILRFCSTQFYDGELIPSSMCLKETHKFKDVLVNPSVPIVFHSIRGQHFVDDFTLSYYNNEEAFQTALYASKLCKISGISHDDIMIITPYRKQVEKIEEYITLLKVPPPRIGSIEEFQGQESSIVLFSTVRSSFQCDKNSLLLGYVGDPKKINVAITRATSLLIVVGDHLLLSTSTVWESFIDYCRSIGAFKGSSFGNEKELFID